MAVPIFGKRLSTIGKLSITYDTDNLILVTVNDTSFPALVKSFRASRSERIQVVPCFNDSTHIYSFGKNPIQGVISGFSLPDKLEAFVNLYKNKLRAYKLKSDSLITISNKGDSMKALFVDLSYDIDAESPVIASFVMNFIALEDSDTVTTSNVAAATTSTGSPVSPPSTGAGAP